MKQQSESAPTQQEQTIEFTLSPLKIKQLKEQPILEGHIGTSKDGKWFMDFVGIKQIYPISYLEKVLETARQRAAQAE